MIAVVLFILIRGLGCKIGAGVGDRKIAKELCALKCTFYAVKCTFYALRCIFYAVKCIFFEIVLGVSCRLGAGFEAGRLRTGGCSAPPDLPAAAGRSGRMPVCWRWVLGWALGYEGDPPQT